MYSGRCHLIAPSSPQIEYSDRARCARLRYKNRPLPGIDDESLESVLFFAMLSPERKARVQAATNFREKRLALLKAAQEQTGTGEGDETR